MSKDTFDTDFNQELYKIEIIVCKNGYKSQISPIKDDYVPTVFETIGVLQYMISLRVFEQSHHNKWETLKVAEAILKNELNAQGSVATVAK